MSLLWQGKRQTGRTRRMVAKAVELAREGRAVYIMTVDQRYATDIRSMLPDEPLGIKVEGCASVSNFDFDELRLRGAHPNCTVLVDHAAIEARYGKVLNEWLRYDDDTDALELRDQQGGSTENETIRYASLWAIAPHWVNAIATDKDGIVYYYSHDPTIIGDYWVHGGLFGKAGQCDPTPDWRDSLERRPSPAPTNRCPYCCSEI